MMNKLADLPSLSKAMSTVDCLGTVDRRTYQTFVE